MLQLHGTVVALYLTHAMMQDNSAMNFNFISHGVIKLSLLVLSTSALAFEIEELSINGLHQAIQNNQTTFTKTMQSYLDAIAKNDQKGAQLNSIILLNPQALQQAALADQNYQQTGQLKPLQGIPVLIKDNIETQHLTTTAGAISLKDNTPSQNAYLIQKLEDAGAIIIAKTNLHEFAVWGETKSSILGQTRNPYDLSRTPGGSSGGTGAAVAANFGLLGIGTDTINSIRSPASANNLVGVRPTMGLVSRSGIVPYSNTQDTAGPITRTVSDAAAVLTVIAGEDPTDPITHAAQSHSTNYTAALQVDGLKNKRIGVLHAFFGHEQIHQETNHVSHEALKQMQRQGAVLVDLHYPINADELVSQTSLHLYDLQDDLNTYLIDHPVQQPVGTLKALLQSGRYDQGIHDNLEKAATLSKADEEYQQRLKKRADLQQLVQALIEINDLDAIVFPHQKRLVVPIGETQVERNGVLGSVTGFPSIVVPVGMSPVSNSAPLGVPIGLEILGAPFSETTLFEIAYGLEQNLPARKKPILQ